MDAPYVWVYAGRSALRCIEPLPTVANGAAPAMIADMAERPYRAGDSIEDHCRACKLDRRHTVIAADGDGRPIRVACGYCGSEHNYRGGPRMDETRGTATGAP